MPALVLLGYATALWQIMLATALIWFAGGSTITLVNVVTGQLGNGRKGTLYGLLAMAYPIGSVIGGAVVGQLIALYGYRTMFLALAALWSALPLIGILGFRPIGSPAPRRAAAAAPAAPLAHRFQRLLIAALPSALAINVSRLGTSLSMHGLGFAASAVASTLPPAALSRGIPRLNAADSIANIVGFAGAGFVMDTLGPAGLYLSAGALVLVAAPVPASLRGKRDARQERADYALAAVEVRR